MGLAVVSSEQNNHGGFRMQTKVQVSNSEKTHKVAISNVEKSEYMGPVDPSNQNTDGLSFTSAGAQGGTFKVNLNSDGSFQNFQTDISDAKMLNVMRGWASLFQLRKGNQKS